MIVRDAAVLIDVSGRIATVSGLVADRTTARLLLE
jgi:hypothetical protein